MSKKLENVSLETATSHVTCGTKSKSFVITHVDSSILYGIVSNKMSEESFRLHLFLWSEGLGWILQVLLR